MSLYNHRHHISLATFEQFDRFYASFVFIDKLRRKIKCRFLRPFFRLTGASMSQAARRFVFDKIQSTLDSILFLFQSKMILTYE